VLEGFGTVCHLLKVESVLLAGYMYMLMFLITNLQREVCEIRMEVVLLIKSIPQNTQNYAGISVKT
jgi:hypothetical protein